MPNPPGPLDSSEPHPDAPVPDPDAPMAQIYPKEVVKEVGEAMEAMSEAHRRYWQAAWRQGWSAGYHDGRLAGEVTVRNSIRIDEANSTPVDVTVTEVEGVPMFPPAVSKTLPPRQER